MAEQLKEQVKELRDHDEQVLQKVEAQRQEMDTLREEMQAEVEEQREEITTMREEAAEARGRAEMQAKVEAQREEITTIREQMLETRATAAVVIALQNRLEALSAAKLLTDDELYSVEDIIADAAEPAEDDQLAMLLALSARMTGDGAFARQLRRKVTS